MWPGMIEPGDVEKGLAAAAAVGDNRLQNAASGTVVPESFTHGTSEQRMRWLRRGIDSAEIQACDTFNAKEL
jgi:predicted metalloprotease